VATAPASGVGFPSYLCAAVKTGTAQTDPTTGLTDTWMIGFAPANNPQGQWPWLYPSRPTAPTAPAWQGPS